MRCCLNLRDDEHLQGVHCQRGVRGAGTGVGCVHLGGSVCDEAKEERAQGAEVGGGGKGDGGGQKTVAVVPEKGQGV